MTKLPKKFSNSKNTNILSSDKELRILELVSLFKSGERSVFPQIAAEYDKRIHYIAKSFSLPQSELDDLYQEGLIALYRAALLYDNSLSSFSTFADLCIKRRMITLAKSYYAKPQKSISVEDVSDIEVFNFEPSLEERIISREMYKLLREKAVMFLSAFEKKVFSLYMRDMNVGEIASILSVSKKSVENAIFRIKSKLKSDGIEF